MSTPAGPVARPGPEPPSLTVTTWNVNGGTGLDVAAVAGWLRSLGTDVAVLQEVQRGQARALAAVLGWRGHWVFKHHPLVRRAEGLAVVSARPFERHGRPVRLQGGPFWSFRRRVAFAVRVGPLAVYDVHLASGGDEEGRLRQVDRLLGAVGDEALAGPLVVAGDLNAGPGSAVLARLVSAGLRDAGGSETNWSKRSGRQGPPDQRLDYVLVSAPLQVLSAAVPDDVAELAALSDHVPLTVTVSGPAPAAPGAAAGGGPAG